MKATPFNALQGRALNQVTTSDGQVVTFTHTTLERALQSFSPDENHQIRATLQGHGDRKAVQRLVAERLAQYQSVH